MITIKILADNRAVIHSDDGATVVLSGDKARGPIADYRGVCNELGAGAGDAYMAGFCAGLNYSVTDLLEQMQIRTPRHLARVAPRD
jgi:sugar/nucleoside kinase (ribokinase family)